MTSPYADSLLAGKRILITGGGTGLGRGVAQHLVQHGADVHLWGRRLGVLEVAAEEASGSRPGSVHVHVVDVRQFDRVDAAMETIWREHGPLTGVVNNAAANFIARTESLSPRAFEAVTSTVMNGSFHTTLAAGRRWIAEGPAWQRRLDADHLGVDGFGVRRPVGDGQGGRARHDHVSGSGVGQARHSRQRTRAGPDPPPTTHGRRSTRPTGVRWARRRPTRSRPGGRAR